MKRMVDVEQIEASELRQLLRFSAHHLPHPQGTSTAAVRIRERAEHPKELVQSIWTLSEIVMTNAVEQTHTELTIKSVRYNTGLTEADFSRRELERK